MSQMDLVSLITLFHELNRLHFGGLLPLPKIIWNSRLRTSAGRFRPGSHTRRHWARLQAFARPCEIEIATYLALEADSLTHIRNTMAHEMIHYWLWFKRRPYGHTEEFHAKMKEFGDIRYNPVPQRRPYKYLYACPACEKEVPARKKLGTVACRDCCDEFTDGRFSPQFKMVVKNVAS